MSRIIPVALLVLVFSASARAELKSLDISRREPFAGGAAFGDTGPYERLIGVAHFAVDPKHPRNKDIVDLHLAPRNADGKVEFEADVFLLVPKDLARGNRALLYDVNNRGNKLALGMFNSGGGGNDPKTMADAGNGFLFRRGYTVVWCGWIGELLPGNNRLLLRAPVATDGGKPIRGIVRYEMVADAPAETMPLSRREGHGSYSPSAKGEAEGVLTWRKRETDRARRHSARAVVAGTTTDPEGRAGCVRDAGTDPLSGCGRLSAWLPLRAGLRGRGADRSGSRLGRDARSDLVPPL